MPGEPASGILCRLDRRKGAPMARRTPCVGGNWKMNTRSADAVALAGAVVADASPEVEVIVFPPAVYLPQVHEVVAGTSVSLGGQDVSDQSDGAWTGQVSAEMLVDVGCSHVLVGHSERRHGLEEPDALLNAKVHAALRAGLSVMLCIGETLNEREAGTTAEVVVKQVRDDLEGVPGDSLSALTIAYEPVWAIGTGLSATRKDIEEMHATVREVIKRDDTLVLYGGSVSPESAVDVFNAEGVSGALVGGASLNADKFAAIVAAWERK